MEEKLRPMERSKIECGRKHFEALNNDVAFTAADKAELQLVIHEFLTANDGAKSVIITDLNENYFSTVLKRLCEKVCGTGYTPTHFSNTFIRNALKNGNYIWEVSKLTLEGTSTIEKHISDEAGIELRQLSILNGF